MSSKKRKMVTTANEHTDEEDKNTKKHPGGPLQRTGKSADSWNEAVGSSISVIPQSYLPTKRTILRRYRFLRTNNELATTSDLAKDIRNEVIYIYGTVHEFQPVPRKMSTDSLFR